MMARSNYTLLYFHLKECMIMMKKNMKKMAGLLVMAMSLSIGGTFAAAPAFDTPQEWLAAQKLKEEASRNVYSENYDYMAAPAFDTPQ